MTDEQIIEMAKQAGAIPIHKDFDQLALIGTENVKAFAKLVAEHEREACAKLRKTLSAIPNSHVPQLQPAVDSALDFYAERIRARGEA
jgi:hypothetical protein